MASNEHIELSTYIKHVHKKLRENTKLMGGEKAWKLHCEDKETLDKYAVAMEELASTHWKQNQDKPDSKALSRINWVYDNCLSYFQDGGLIYQRQREHDIAKKNEITRKSELETFNPKYRLLDVGSCYNPFKIYDIFDVLPIDIAPANNNVLQCDFLNLNIINIIPTENNGSKIIELQSDSFDVIVFSLLLEYLPAARQRLLCCENAYKLLKYEGVLIIITPDAKHVGANAKFMKSWRFVLAKLGFCRIKYEKLPYIHCMMFRKSLNCDVAARWAELNKDKKLFEEIFIPQDFNNKDAGL